MNMEEKNESLTQEAVCSFLSSTFMFREVDADTLLKITAECDIEITEFSSGDKIFTPHDFEEKIGFVVSGKCEVNKLRDGKPPLPLNTLDSGASFGVLTLFSKKESYPTEIAAKKRSTVLFITRSDAVRLIEKNPQIAKNFISFLSDRVAFLNDKISTFSADNVEQKLAKFLVSSSYGNGGEPLEINHKRTAEIINSGRASLYRALDALSEKGIIKIENKKIFILDFEGLERISK